MATQICGVKKNMGHFLVCSICKRLSIGEPSRHTGCKGGLLESVGLFPGKCNDSLPVWLIRGLVQRALVSKGLTRVEQLVEWLDLNELVPFMKERVKGLVEYEG
jgi:hypothetical protein